jgi:hypothetical protein
MTSIRARPRDAQNLDRPGETAHPCPRELSELVSKVAFVVGGLEASGSGSRLADPVGTFSRDGIRSREAPVTARLFVRAQGRCRAGCRATPSVQHHPTAPDNQTAGRFETSEHPATFESSSQRPKRLVIGSRRSRPNALWCTLIPGGACRRLYSARSTRRATRFATSSVARPRRAISSGERSSST